MKKYKDIFTNDDNYNMNGVMLSKLIYDKKISNITVPLGIEKSTNRRRYIDFSDISCLLIGGETGAGKSVFIDSIIVTLLLNNNNIEFVLMDPKKVELSFYEELEQTRKLLSDGLKCLDELKNIYNEYLNRRTKIKNITDYNKLCEKKMNHIFIIIDESCKLMEYSESENILNMMINDSCKYGIHFIIASNSIWDKYFSKEFMNQINYIITFDLSTEEDAMMIGNIKAKNLESPGNAIAIEGEYKEFNILTPYVSDEEILNTVNYLKKEGK